MDRQPHRVASNLVWDATAVLLAASRREELHVEHSTVLDENLADETYVDNQTTGDVLQPAVEAGVITPIDATLIDATRLRGVDLHASAQLLGISYEAAKKRRRRAEAAWAQWWDPRDRHRAPVNRANDARQIEPRMTCVWCRARSISHAFYRRMGTPVSQGRPASGTTQTLRAPSAVRESRRLSRRVRHRGCRT